MKDYLKQLLNSSTMPEDIAVEGVTWKQFKKEFLEKLDSLPEQIPPQELTKLVDLLNSGNQKYNEAHQKKELQASQPPPAPVPQTPRQAEFNARAANPPAQPQPQQPAFTDNRDLLRRPSPENPDRAELHVTNTDYGNRLDLIAVGEVRDGQIRIAGTGEPGNEDPGSGMIYRFDPNTNQLTVVNRLVIAENGSVIERTRLDHKFNPPIRVPDPHERTYDLNFTAAAGSGAPAHVMNDPRGPFERVREVSESGNLEIRAVKAQASFAEGNLAVIYKDPATGTTTTLYINEDTVVVDKTGRNGQTMRAEQRLEFPDHGAYRDFRYQPPTPAAPAREDENPQLSQATRVTGPAVETPRFG